MTCRKAQAAVEIDARRSVDRQHFIQKPRANLAHRVVAITTLETVFAAEYPQTFGLDGLW
jgi:hypothetical protein